MTSNGTLDERYLEWLYNQIGSYRNRNPLRSYWQLAVSLYKKPFTWSVPNDDNRIADGLDLREEFIRKTKAERDRDWLALECSMLEMMVALSRRAAFESSGDAYEWFWVMADNIGLRRFNDAAYNNRFEARIEEIVDRVIERRYKSNGEGGLFPLIEPQEDQREVEIWYQMAAYLLENDNAIDD